jgi:hypothetical protein
MPVTGLGEEGRKEAMMRLLMGRYVWPNRGRFSASMILRGPPSLPEYSGTIFRNIVDQNI